MLWLPSEPGAGVYVTEHMALPLSVQDAALKAPLPLLLHETVPVAVIAVPVSESVTVAAQVVAALTGIVAGVQPTDVVADRTAMPSELDPELAEWSLSPE